MQVHFPDGRDGWVSNVNSERHLVQELLGDVVQLRLPVLPAEDPGKDVKASTRTTPAEVFCHLGQFDSRRVTDDGAILLLVAGKANDQLIPDAQIWDFWPPFSEDCDSWLDITIIQRELEVGGSYF